MKEWAVRYAKSFSATRYNGTLSLLRRTLQTAVDNGILYSNPATQLERKAQKAKHLELPTREQFATFIAEMRRAQTRDAKNCADLAEGLAFTGCRISESAEIEWRDLNFETGEILVKGDPEEATKNGEIRRGPMIPQARELFAKMREARADEAPSAKVFRVNECQHSMDAAGEKIGMARITHHDLRHFFATVSIESGVDIPTVSRWLGHKDGGALAMRTYGRRGRPPVGIERMRRRYFLAQWYALADEALADALDDSQALRNFAGRDPGRAAVPDAPTPWKFRHLLAAHELGRRIFAEVGALLAEQQRLMRAGPLGDATIIAAPSPTRNRRRERDPARPQTRKGHQWDFGMKAHLGADETSGLVPSVEGTAANVSDISQAHALLHGEEKRGGADAGGTGVQKRPEVVALGRAIAWRGAARRSAHQAQPEGWAKALDAAWETLKARTRALVEPPFHSIRNLFKHRQVRSRGLEKNTGPLRGLFARANLYLVRRQWTGAAAT